MSHESVMSTPRMSSRSTAATGLPSARLRPSAFRWIALIPVSLTLLGTAAGAVPDRGEGVPDATVATFRERNGAVFADWPTPRAVIVVTGELDGYIEPCGCTGKENQKGGLSRRRNFLRAIEAAGWPLVAVDLGGQVRRFGRQTEAKFQSIVDGLRAMGYAGVGFGPADLRLPPFIGGNVGLLGIDAGITPRFRVVEAGGLRIGITTVLGDGAAAQFRNDDVQVVPSARGLADVAAGLARERCDHQILLAWATPEETRALAKAYPQFDARRTRSQGHVRRGRRPLRCTAAATCTARAARRPLG
jgi:hypothetical protein